MLVPSLSKGTLLSGLALDQGEDKRAGSVGRAVKKRICSLSSSDGGRCLPYKARSEVNRPMNGDEDSPGPFPNHMHAWGSHPSWKMCFSLGTTGLLTTSSWHPQLSPGYSGVNEPREEHIFSLVNGLTKTLGAPLAEEFFSLQGYDAALPLTSATALLPPTHCHLHPPPGFILLSPSCAQEMKVILKEPGACLRNEMCCF